MHVTMLNTFVGSEDQTQILCCKVSTNRAILPKHSPVLSSPSLQKLKGSGNREAGLALRSFVCVCF